MVANILGGPIHYANVRNTSDSIYFMLISYPTIFLFYKVNLNALRSAPTLLISAILVYAAL